MDSPAFAGKGCAYDNGQCKMLSLNYGPKDGKPVVYSWMTTGPDAGKCCIEGWVPVVPPDFVRGLEPRPDITMKAMNDKFEPVDEPVQWYSVPGETHSEQVSFFRGFFKNKFITDSDGQRYQLTAMHGGHTPLN